MTDSYRFTIAVQKGVTPPNSDKISPQLLDFIFFDGESVNQPPLIKDRLVIGYIIDQEDPVVVKKFSDCLPIIIRINGVWTAKAENDAAVLSWIEERVVTATRCTIRLFQQNERSLALSRSRVQELEQDLKEIETAFISYGYPGRRVSIDIPSRGVFATMNADETTEYTLSQKINAYVNRISGFSILVNKGAAHLKGEVSLQLVKTMSNTSICDVTLPLSAFSYGWNEFECQIPSNDYPETLSLHVTVKGPDASGFFLGLSDVSPIITDGAQAADGRHLNRPLAFRAWSSLTHVPSQVFSTTIGRNDETVNGVVIPVELLRQAEVYDVPAKVDFNAVEFQLAHHSLLVHPVGPKPTVAVVRNIRIPSASRITAVIDHRHAEGAAVEFAICAVPSKIKPRFGMDRFSTMSLSELRWVMLRGLEWGEVSALVDFPSEEYFDIYLLTRTSEEPHLAWAVFRNIVIYPR